MRAFALKPIPARRVVAITFFGLSTNAAIEAHSAELRRFAVERNLATKGEPILAFYNPPWTLPFFRRNEIMLEVSG